MTYTLQFTEEFDQDLSNIIWWYAIQREGLEQEFRLSFETAVLLIQDNPLSFQAEHRDVRRAVLRRFPYKIYYKVYEERILFLGIFHTSRDPKLIRKRKK